MHLQVPDRLKLLRGTVPPKFRDFCVRASQPYSAATYETDLEAAAYTLLTGKAENHAQDSDHGNAFHSWSLCVLHAFVLSFRS